MFLLYRWFYSERRKLRTFVEASGFIVAYTIWPETAAIFGANAETFIYIFAIAEIHFGASTIRIRWFSNACCRTRWIWTSICYFVVRWAIFTFAIRRWNGLNAVRRTLTECVYSGVTRPRQGGFSELIRPRQCHCQAPHTNHKYSRLVKIANSNLC